MGETLTLENLHSFPTKVEVPVPQFKIPTWILVVITILTLGGGYIAYSLYKKSKVNKILADTNNNLLQENESLKTESLKKRLFAEAISGIKNK